MKLSILDYLACSRCHSSVHPSGLIYDEDGNITGGCLIYNDCQAEFAIVVT